MRGLFYLPVVWDARAAILELSSVSASHFEQHAKLLHQGIRPGLVVRLRRRSKRSPVHSEVTAFFPSARSVELSEFVGKVMALYHFPGPNPGEEFSVYEARLREMVLSRSERERRHYQSVSDRGVQGRR